MSTQVQVRGATNGTQQARTLASRELDIDTSNYRLSIHDGATVGGIEHANFRDVQNQSFYYGTAAGTNTLTVTISPAPASYVAGMRVVIRAAANNTASATLNVNSLGAVTIRKKDTATAAIVNLSANDLLQDGIYSLIYDGTYFQLVSTDGGGLASVSQGDLNTSIGTFSLNTFGDTTRTIGADSGNNELALSDPGAYVTLPGGQYGFFPQSRGSTAGTISRGWVLGGESAAYITSAWAICWGSDSNSAGTVEGQQRYITSSPPFDMGDGEVGGFFFAKVNKQGEILSHYFADVPPWGYNGPTNIKAEKICRITGTKYRRVCRPMTREQILDGAKLEYEYQVITQKIKNADMHVIPHPFGLCKPGESIVLIDPMDKRIRSMIEFQNIGEDVSDIIRAVKLDNEFLKRKGPNGVPQVRFRV